MRAFALVVVVGCHYQAPVTAGGDAPPVDARADAAAGDAAADATAFTCPQDYVALPGAPSKYKKYGADGSTTPSPSPGRATWIAAEQACRADGPGIHLAIPEDEAEHQALSDIVSGASRWLGVTDRKTEGTWLPIIGGTAHVEHWLGGAPDQSSALYDCYLLTRIQANGSNQAEATPCNGEGSLPANQWDKGYICECDGQSVDQSTF